MDQARHRLKEEKMEDLFPVLFWSGPIGIGVFLAGLGVLFWGISRMREWPKKAQDQEESPLSAKDR